MIKNLLTAVICLLAINFLAVGAGVGWLVSSHHLDRERITSIKAIVFPAPATQPAGSPAGTSAPHAATQPADRLAALLAKESGHTPGEQMDFMQHTFDAQMAELDRRERELDDLKQQTDLAQAKITQDRAALTADQKQLTDSRQQAAQLASDKGFQDSLALYQTMQPKQVKSIFLGLDDTTVENYLRAMEPRAAGKIIKEYKTPEETARIERIMERIRQSTPPAGAGSANNSAAGAIPSAGAAPSDAGSPPTASAAP